MLQASVNYTTAANETLLDVSYPSNGEKAAFDILDTDFTNYAITYSCSQISTGVLPMKEGKIQTVRLYRAAEMIPVPLIEGDNDFTKIPVPTASVVIPSSDLYYLIPKHLAETPFNYTAEFL